MTSPGRWGPSSAPEPYSEGDAVLVLDELVRRALQTSASDIHLEPKREHVQVRFRIDGTMVEQRSIGYELAPQIVQRIKVLARMDIAERRVPQDGQFSLDPQGQSVHLRASTFPCSLGEKVVLRLLRGHNLIAFGRLGLEETEMRRVRDIMQRPQGFVVTCGPTGSGKTSTLYALLQLIDTARVNVVTLEDPIEVELMNITQGQTNVRAGFTFAAGLRAILRQDPDVILVGEIRDAETAAIALQAALTGHLVLSTLHTSDTVETVVRLVDLGVEPWIIANALSSVIAQRLVRIVCPSCTAKVKLQDDFWDGDEVLLPAGSEVVRPSGCADCLRTGYKGRTGLFEVLEIDDDLRDLIKAKATAPAYRAILQKRRIRSLRRAGFAKVQAGITTVEEVLRVTTLARGALQGPWRPCSPRQGVSGTHGDWQRGIGKMSGALRGRQGERGAWGRPPQAPPWPRQAAAGRGGSWTPRSLRFSRDGLPRVDGGAKAAGVV